MLGHCCGGARIWLCSRRFSLLRSVVWLMARMKGCKLTAFQVGWSTSVWAFGLSKIATVVHMRCRLYHSGSKYCGCIPPKKCVGQQLATFWNEINDAGKLIRHNVIVFENGNKSQIFAINSATKFHGERWTCARQNDCAGDMHSPRA